MAKNDRILGGQIKHTNPILVTQGIGEDATSLSGRGMSALSGTMPIAGSMAGGSAQAQAAAMKQAQRTGKAPDMAGAAVEGAKMGLETDVKSVATPDTIKDFLLTAPLQAANIVPGAGIVAQGAAMYGLNRMRADEQMQKGLKEKYGTQPAVSAAADLGEISKNKMRKVVYNPKHIIPGGAKDVDKKHPMAASDMNERTMQPETAGIIEDFISGRAGKKQETSGATKLLDALKQPNIQEKGLGAWEAYESKPMAHPAGIGQTHKNLREALHFLSSPQGRDFTKSVSTHMHGMPPTPNTPPAAPAAQPAPIQPAAASVAAPKPPAQTLGNVKANVSPGSSPVPSVQDGYDTGHAIDKDEEMVNAMAKKQKSHMGLPKGLTNEPVGAYLDDSDEKFKKSTTIVAVSDMSERPRQVETQTMGILAGSNPNMVGAKETLINPSVAAQPAAVPVPGGANIPNVSPALGLAGGAIGGGLKYAGTKDPGQIAGGAAGGAAGGVVGSQVGQAAGSAIGGAAGSVLPGIGNVVGAGLGGLGGGILGGAVGSGMGSDIGAGALKQAGQPAAADESDSVEIAKESTEHPKIAQEHPELIPQIVEDHEHEDAIEKFLNKYSSPKESVNEITKNKGQPAPEDQAVEDKFLSSCKY